jgi:membrane associated rhomboid family serine protease
MQLDDEIDDMWVEVGRFRAQSDAEQNALVLVASGVASRLVSNGTGIALQVPASDAVRARSEMALYAYENRPRPVSGPALRPIREGLDAALLYCVVLVFIHAAANRGAFSHDWLAIGHANASLIKSGEWWRAVTALSLHADIEHLLSNIVLGGMLGLLLAQLLGPGLAWLAILIGGAIGNTVVAFVAPADYSAIGASTAVFAALGLLATLAWRRQAIVWKGLRRWRPIAAAVMLLALLGIGGERIDVGGHVAGFLAGCAEGVALYFVRSHLPRDGKAQLAYGAAAIALFAGSWLAAFASG